MAAELFMQMDAWTVRQTDMTKLLVIFRNFSNAPKTHLYLLLSNSARYLELNMNRH